LTVRDDRMCSIFQTLIYDTPIESDCKTFPGYERSVLNRKQTILGHALLKCNPCRGILIISAQIGRRRSREERTPLARRSTNKLLHSGGVVKATGHRMLFKEFAPPDRTGLLSLREIFVTDDLRSYAYTAYYQVSSLFVSDGRE
jgi:hypothetical protein